MNGEVILFPDVEGLLRIYILAELASRSGYSDVVVATKVPHPRPARFIRILRTGGSTPNLVTDEATIVVETWSQSEVDAVHLAQLCRGLLRALDTVEEVQFYRVDSYSAPANLPDPASAQVRYTAQYAVRVRGAAE
jgi:hypothetical protein